MCPGFPFLVLDFWLCSNPADGMREGAQGVCFRRFAFWYFGKACWRHNELFDRAIIFVATYLDLFAGALCIYGYSTVVN